MHEWRDHELLRRALDVFGLAALAEQEEAPAEVHELARRPPGGARGAGLRRGRRAARARSRPPAGRCGTTRAATGSSRGGDARAGLRPPARARGAARPARGARALGDRAGARGRALAADEGPCACRSSPIASWARRRGRATTRACSPGASRTATPTRTSSRRVERPLLACLDQVTDPRNLGAVFRSAEGAGATGVVVPGPRLGEGDGGGLPRLGRRGRAPAGRRRPEPRALSERDQARPTSGSTRPPPDAEQDLWEADLSGGLALVFGAEGKGVRPLVRRACDGDVSIPLAGRVESLNVSVAAALLLYEARRRRDG